MTDENQTPSGDEAVNTGNDQSQVESPTTEIKSPEQSVKDSPDVGDSTPDSPELVKEDDSTTAKSDSHTEPDKPEKSDKANKRIRDLVGKLKGKDEEIRNLQPLTPEWAKSDPFDNLGDTLTPEQLRGVVSSEASKIARTEIAFNEAKTKYINAVNDHVSDLEKVANQISEDYSDDKATASELNQLLVELNEQANFDSQGRFVPRVKTSELYAKMKKTLARERTSGENKAITSIKEDNSTAAIRPTTKQDETPAMEDLKAMQWKNPGKVAKILEAKLSQK